MRVDDVTGSSKWQNLRPIICNACRSKEEKNKVTISDPNFSAKDNYPLLGNSSSIITEISPSSSSISHENLAFSVTQIGMIFGNLTFEPTLAIPFILRGKSLEPTTVKSEVVTADYDFVTQVQNDFHRGKPSTTSALVDDSTIQIKQEPAGKDSSFPFFFLNMFELIITVKLINICAESDAENEEAFIWDMKKVKKKKRSNLPQYTLSPLARFINQLRHASYYRRRRLRPRPVGPKYDDVLIYEKCAMHVPENEIGLGAELLSPPPVYEYSRKTTSLPAMNKEEKRN